MSDQKKTDKNTVFTTVNQGYYGPDEYNTDQSDILKKIYDSKRKQELDPNSKEYKRICPISFRKIIDKEPKLVYEVVSSGDQYYIKTGLFIGYINIAYDAKSKPIRLEIDTGYNPLFLRRMLCCASNILFDDTDRENVRDDLNNDSILSTILEYLFLVNFRKAFASGIPSHYRRIIEKGLNLKGRLLVKDYIQKDMLYGYKLTYSYDRLEYVQDIIDVLYMAMYAIASDNKSSRLMNDRDFANHYRKLKQMYSGRRISLSTVKRVVKHKSLNNPMYSKYKKALIYASYILKHKNLIYDSSSSQTGNPGFLIDVSELWELYLATLLETNYAEKGFIVKSQDEIPIYSDTFFARSNEADIVMESEDTIVVLDAKFKKMKYRVGDVDRGDLHQIHSYAGYYQLRANKEGKKLRVCSLVYPTKGEPSDPEKCVSVLYGPDPSHEDSEVRFAIGYIVIPEVTMESEFVEKMRDEENAFIKRLDDLIYL